MKITSLSFRSILLTITLAFPLQVFSDDALYTRSVTGDFDDIRIDVENALLNRGFVIDLHAKIGEMLDRTAADVGSTRSVFANADSWQFCSAILSRKMVETNPANIAFCPYIVFAYATSEAPNDILVGFRYHIGTDQASKEVLDEVDSLLKSIVDEVVE